MEEKQEHKYYVCRICEQKFSSGRQLGGHMRCHSATNSNRRKQGIQEIKQEAINVDMGVDVYAVDRQITKPSQDFSNQDNNNVGRKRGLDDGVNVHVMRKNAKRSWSGSSSSKDYGNYVCKHCGKEFDSSKDLDEHRRSHTRKDVMENAVCITCGKVFESLQALYGHMSCHSMKKASKECDKPSDVYSVLSYDEEVIEGVDCLMMLSRGVRELDGVNKFSSDVGSVLSYDEEVIGGAVCLMMLSRGVRQLDGAKLKASNQAKFAFQNSSYKRTVEGKVDGGFGVL